MSWNNFKQAVARTKRDVHRMLRNPVFRGFLDAVVFALGGTVGVVALAFGMVNYPIITAATCVGLTIAIGLGKLTLMTFRHYRNIKGE